MRSAFRSCFLRRARTFFFLVAPSAPQFRTGCNRCHPDCPLRWPRCACRWRNHIHQRKTVDVRHVVDNRYVRRIVPDAESGAVQLPSSPFRNPRISSINPSPHSARCLAFHYPRRPIRQPTSISSDRSAPLQRRIAYQPDSIHVEIPRPEADRFQHICKCSRSVKKQLDHQLQPGPGADPSPAL